MSATNPVRCADGASVRVVVRSCATRSGPQVDAIGASVSLVSHPEVAAVIKANRHLVERNRAVAMMSVIREFHSRVSTKCGDAAVSSAHLFERFPDGGRLELYRRNLMDGFLSGAAAEQE